MDALVVPQITAYITDSTQKNFSVLDAMVSWGKRVAYLENGQQVGQSKVPGMPSCMMGYSHDALHASRSIDHTANSKKPVLKVCGFQNA